jgi:ribosomal protein L29
VEKLLMAAEQAEEMRPLGAEEVRSLEVDELKKMLIEREQEIAQLKQKASQPSIYFGKSN